MAASFNRVILLGNLTRDVELRCLDDKTFVADIGLAVNHRRKDRSGTWLDEPVFVDVTLWRRLAEVAREYLAKGSPVLIEGRLKLNTWTQDGQKRSKLTVVGERLQLISSKPREDPSHADVAPEQDEHGHVYHTVSPF